MDRHGLTAPGQPTQNSLRGIISHPKIENLVGNYIQMNQQYIVIDIAPNGNKSISPLSGSDIRGNCVGIFGKTTHGYTVYSSKGILVFQYQGGISRDTFSVLGACPANVEALLSGEIAFH